MTQDRDPVVEDSDVNGPLQIDFIALPEGGRIGMVHCPGRTGQDGRGRQWSRDLAADIAAIRAAGARTLVTLIEEAELIHYGVEALPETAVKAGLHWIHWPIADMQTATGASAQAMARGLPALLETLSEGQTVVIHCAAGLGRTGTLAAQLLVLAGHSAEDAISTIRTVRPGTIETEAQADAVRQFRRIKA